MQLNITHPTIFKANLVIKIQIFKIITQTKIIKKTIQNKLLHILNAT